MTSKKKRNNSKSKKKTKKVNKKIIINRSYKYLINESLKTAKYWSKLCSKKKSFNSKIIVTTKHPANDAHISLSNDKQFLNEHKQNILDNPMTCKFKIKKFILFKSKNKGPYKPPYFDKNADYPLIWFTAIVEIIDIDFKYKDKTNFNKNLLKNKTFFDNLQHVTLSILSLQNDINNNCNIKLGYTPIEEMIEVKHNKKNDIQLNKLIKKLNKFKQKVFTGYTNIDDKDFLAYFIDKTHEYKLLEKQSKNILKYIFKDIL